MILFSYLQIPCHCVAKTTFLLFDYGYEKLSILLPTRINKGNAKKETRMDLFFDVVPPGVNLTLTNSPIYPQMCIKNDFENLYCVLFLVLPNKCCQVLPRFFLAHFRRFFRHYLSKKHCKGNTFF